MQNHKTKSSTNLTHFTPNFKRKRIPSSIFKASTDLLPSYTSENRIQGCFTGFSVEVTNPENIRKLYDSGCFGKGSKSRSCPEFIRNKKTIHEVDILLSENLLLDLEESFFLSHFLNVLQINDINGILLNSNQLLEKYLKINSRFIEHLVAYIYLRSKNWIVRSGTKFGANFLIYKKGMRFYHASFIVFVNQKDKSHQSKDIKGIQRIAETSDKDVLILEVDRPEEIQDTLQNLDKFTISENIIKRFNYSSFVQLK